MFEAIRKVGILTASVTFLAFAATGLSAQAEKLTVDVRAGGSIPASDGGGFREAVEPGASLGLGASYKVHPRFNLRVDGDVEFLRGDQRITSAGATYPDQRLWHYNAGIEVRVLPERKEPWKLHANLGAGFTTLSVDEFSVNGQVRDISETELALNGSLRLGYELNQSTDVIAAFHSYRTFVDEDDTAALAALGDNLMDAYGSAWTFPFQLGLRYSF